MIWLAASQTKWSLDIPYSNKRVRILCTHENVFVFQYGIRNRLGGTTYDHNIYVFTKLEELGKHISSLPKNVHDQILKEIADHEQTF